MINPIPNKYNTTEITFNAEGEIKAGTPVTIDSDGAAIAAEKGYPFIGICTKADGNLVTVAVAGVISAGYSGESLETGYQPISADGQGNVKLDLSSNYEYRVIKLDAENHTVTIVL